CDGQGGVWQWITTCQHPREEPELAAPDRRRQALDQHEQPQQVSQLRAAFRDSSHEYRDQQDEQGDLPKLYKRETKEIVIHGGPPAAALRGGEARPRRRRSVGGLPPDDGPVASSRQRSVDRPGRLRFAESPSWAAPPVRTPGGAPR